jgi:RNA polymerase sigma factor (sigma-70 family)
MTGTRPAEILRQLEQAGLPAHGLADRELLLRFANHRDQAAFEVLVRRHGPMVLHVCRRVTGHPHDAEDAFQAAFLVLARKAGSIRTPDLLGNWLYGVAVRVAQKARRSAARRRAREVQVVDIPDAAVPPDSPADIGPVLHEELATLPAR